MTTDSLGHKTHVVKSWTMFFSGIIDGSRTSDIRFNDRRYAVGDTMLLREFDPVKGAYTGREQPVVITYLQQNKSNPCAISHEAIQDGYVVLSIRLVQEASKDALQATANTLRTLFGCAAPTLTDAQWRSAASTVLRNARDTVAPQPWPLPPAPFNPAGVEKPAPTPIKGACVQGGYVIVTPARGTNPKALKAAIMDAHLPPAADSIPP